MAPGFIFFKSTVFFFQLTPILDPPFIPSQILFIRLLLQRTCLFFYLASPFTLQPIPTCTGKSTSCNSSNSHSFCRLYILCVFRHFIGSFWLLGSTQIDIFSLSLYGYFTVQVRRDRPRSFLLKWKLCLGIAFILIRETTNIIKSKKNRRRNKKMTPVQRLFETCKDTFASGGSGIIPPPEDIERLQSVLDNIRPEDVGLSPYLRYFRSMDGLQTPPITYLHLHECSKFSMGIFCLPPSGVIPLHDHPGMTVFNKLLFGTVHIKSYDWVVDAARGDSTSSRNPPMPLDGVRLSKVKVDSDFTAPCNASILYPADGGNMHCLTAITACAVLDVLGPPYSNPDDPDGRHCTYYRDLPFATFAVEGVAVGEEDEEKYAWLQERETVEELAVVGAPYRGPKITQN